MGKRYIIRQRGDRQFNIVNRKVIVTRKPKFYYLRVPYITLGTVHLTPKKEFACVMSEELAKMSCDMLNKVLTKPRKDSPKKYKFKLRRTQLKSQWKITRPVKPKAVVDLPVKKHREKPKFSFGER